MAELTLKFYLLLNPKGSQISLGQGAVADIIPTASLAGMSRAIVAVPDDFPKSNVAKYGAISKELTLEEYQAYSEKKTLGAIQFISPIGPPQSGTGTLRLVTSVGQVEINYQNNGDGVSRMNLGSNAENKPVAEKPKAQVEAPAKEVTADGEGPKINFNLSSSLKPPTAGNEEQQIHAKNAETQDNPKRGKRGGNRSARGNRIPQ